MYELGRRTRKRHRKLLGLLMAWLVVASAVGLYKTLHLTTAPQSSVHNAAATTKAYAPGVSTTVHIDKPLFTMDLPSGWSEDISQPTGYTRPGFDFRSSSAEGQALAVYIDTMPASPAINRALVVTAEGARLRHGTVSDNCAAFTSPSKADPNSGMATGLWQGVSFSCDLANYQRNVTGTVSAEGEHVTLTGPKAGRHQVFITYTNTNLNPDYSALYSILNSFSLK